MTASYIVKANDTSGNPLIPKPVDFLFGTCTADEAEMVAIEEWEDEGVEVDHDSVKAEPA